MPLQNKTNYYDLGQTSYLEMYLMICHCSKYSMDLCSKYTSVAATNDNRFPTLFLHGALSPILNSKTSKQLLRYRAQLIWCVILKQVKLFYVKVYSITNLLFNSFGSRKNVECW